MEEEKPQPVRSRPVLLSVFCLFSFVYFFLLFTFLLIALFYSGRISEVARTYLPEAEITKTQVFLLFTSGILLHGTAFAGTLLIWKLKRMGYLLLTLSCLIMASYQLFQPRINITSTGVYILLILLFGLFYRRLQ